ncbi:TetR/AcrR family transcriptional regulator [Enterococcus mediterraneensis]|uniref:TetR/AcrR family transcriptional regulator n=1 Tax=Enterococcus mediterraneensis TaxID=2364791 RepID=UPI000F06FDC3|nr:TetR/AcrR family transcriptional regulator [Enterococcus mediterraneensis]
MKRNTKEDILIESLRLFAHSGYDGVTMRDISGKVGIRQSSLYKHFVGKQEIFDSIVGRMDANYKEQLDKMTLVSGNSNKRAEQYTEKTLNNMADIGEALFLYWTQDEYAALFRKMLIIEQYRNSKLAVLYNKYFLSGVIDFQEAIVSRLIEDGFFKQGNPHLLAMEFYGPIFLMIAAYDTEKNGTTFNELIREHVKNFGKLHAVNVMEE